MVLKITHVKPGLTPPTVVTGRGVPTLAARACDDGVEGCRYLPISSVFEYLVHNPSKLMLMRALWSAASGSAREGVS